jgi:hypothetical protein
MVTFVNLFQDRDDRWELDPEVLGQVLQLAATGATIVALCRRVNRAFDPAQLDHLHVVYPAARGRICARTRYQAHVRLRSTRPRRLPLSEVGLHQREEGPACRGPSPLTTTPNALVCFIENETRRLVWLKETTAAECHLVPIDQPGADHQLCRRLAFALWLRVTDRLSTVNESECPSHLPTQVSP